MYNRPQKIDKLINCRIIFITDGVRLREERRRDGPTTPATATAAAASPQAGPAGQTGQQRSFTSRRSSTDSSEEGFNLNVRDLKVRLPICVCTFVYLCVCLRLSICVNVCLSVYVYVCLSVCTFVLLSLNVCLIFNNLSSIIFCPAV